VRRLLLEDYSLLCEEQCDVRAAESVGNPAVVARALLAVTRLDTAWDEPLPALACRFGPGRTTRRVMALLEPKWVPAETRWALGFGGSLLGVLLLTGFSASTLHHAMESVLSVVF